MLSARPAVDVGRRLGRKEDALEAAEAVVPPQRRRFGFRRRAARVFEGQQGADGLEIGLQCLFFVVGHGFKGKMRVKQQLTTLQVAIAYDFANSQVFELLLLMNLPTHKFASCYCLSFC